MAEKAKKATVCICGGGNGAHVLAGLAAAHARTETRVLTLHENEAEVWTEKMKGGDFIVSRRNPDGTTEEVCQKNETVLIVLCWTLLFFVSVSPLPPDVLCLRSSRLKYNA